MTAAHGRQGRGLRRCAFFCVSVVAVFFGLDTYPSTATARSPEADRLEPSPVTVGTPDPDGLPDRFLVGAPPRRIKPHGPGAGFDPQPGDPAFALRIPAIDLEEIVYQGADQAQLAKGPGHYPSCRSGFVPPYCNDFDEVWPGERGRVVVGGHRTLERADFLRLGELREGDQIHVEARWGNFNYTITDTTIVSPYDRSVIVPGIVERELALVTCHPKFLAAQRLIIFAELTRATEPSRSAASGRTMLQVVR